MKINLPITGQEKRYSDDMTLVSKTDTKGIITFANRDFVEISGYSEEELVGTNHNIIRHPDMPPAAFEVMWKTLKRGLPWQGIVKNRCKSGDHYWVDAKVVPIKKSGEIIGYMSVRKAAARADIEAAEAAYKLAATAPETIKETAVAGWKKYLSIKNGIPLWILFVTLMMIAGGILGIGGLNLSNSAIQSLYYEEMDPVQVIGRINFLMADNRAQVALALHHDPVTHPTAQHDHPMTFHTQTLVKNKEEIDRLWEPYVKRIANETEKGLAEQYWQARNRYVQEGLLKARQALEAGDYPQAEQILLNNVNPLYDQANASVSVLLKHLSDRGLAKFTQVTARNQTIAAVAIAGIVSGCLILIVCGIFFFRVTVMPLHKAVLALEDIAEGNLSGAVDSGGYGEPGRVMAAVTVMQMHLKVMMHEIQQSSDSIHSQCHSLNQLMMNLAEQSEEQHDRVYQTLDAIVESSSGLKAMAASAAALMQSVEGAEVGTAEGAAEAPASALEPMPAELLALFGESPEATPALEPKAASAAAAAARPAVSGGLERQTQEVASAASVQAMAVEETARQLRQIAGLIVNNREAVQGAWAASQHLEQTARELENLVKYFE
ncbi:MAG TPA: Tar ligand binding domain-containing protein [Rhodocyclaceae bacterium]